MGLLPDLTSSRVVMGVPTIVASSKIEKIQPKAVPWTPFSFASAGKNGAMMESPSWPQKVPITIKAKMRSR